jgi:hypothetical protein
MLGSRPAVIRPRETTMLGIAVAKHCGPTNLEGVARPYASALGDGNARTASAAAVQAKKRKVAKRHVVISPYEELVEPRNGVL